MQDALADGGQVILLLNRRGYSTHMQCPACGHVVRCPHCDIALTHHRSRQIALCHYCDYKMPAPARLPGVPVRRHSLQRLGHATTGGRSAARVSRSVLALRMDTDTCSGPEATTGARPRSAKGKVRILLGTQMIAKGLDFPNVRWSASSMPIRRCTCPISARPSEHSIWYQVAGRTGRGPKRRPGAGADVQSRPSGHSGRRTARLRGICRIEMPMRQLLAYPPFASMVRLVVRGPVQKTTEEFTAHVAERLTAAAEKHAAQARVLGPAPAPFAKLRGKFRFQIQLQSPLADNLRAAVAEATKDLKPPEDIQWIVDVDPLDML